MEIGASKELTTCRDFFLQPSHPKQRQYEAMRAYFVDGRPSHLVAAQFGYSPGAFRVLCHQFRRDSNPSFFASSRRGPPARSRKSTARDQIVELRKRNHSVYEISAILKDGKIRLSPTAVRQILHEEGFAPLPRRLDDERPEYPRPTIEPVADVRAFLLTPRRFATRFGGLFLFVPDLIQLNLNHLAASARLPGSRMIPATHALRACLSLKLWSIERKSHIMSVVSDEGLALFAGLNVSPKKSYFSEYSSPIRSETALRLLALWHEQLQGDSLLADNSFDLDFHSVPYYGEHPVVERHYVSARSRRQPSILVFLAHDADGRAFCYSNANIRKGEEAEEIFRFIAFWKKTHGKLPAHLVFDSRLTTLENLARLDGMGITFITLRRRSPSMLEEISQLPASAWRRITLDLPTRKFQTPRVYEQKIHIRGKLFRQIYVQDLGHDQPTILLTNDSQSFVKLITRYAQRMLVENAISDAVRFFHMDALSSAVGLKVDFDMALLVIASGLYRRLARRMRGYRDAQARQLFRDIVDSPATIAITEGEVLVQFHRRAHLPIILASDLINKPVSVPWWHDYSLRLTA
jgi:transposase-like protein